MHALHNFGSPFFSFYYFLLYFIVFICSIYLPLRSIRFYLSRLVERHQGKQRIVRAAVAIQSEMDITSDAINEWNAQEFGDLTNKISLKYLPYAGKTSWWM